MARKPYVNVPLYSYLKGSVKGNAKKERIVMHETVSHDREGLSDIRSVAAYLGKIGYGIHLIVDQEGKTGQFPGDNAIFWHAKGDNTRTIGIELISYVPGITGITRWQRFNIWRTRERQLHKAARWLAYYSDKHGIPLKYTKGYAPGICSHWDVSQVRGIVGGHWDCHPKHRDGHFPLLRLIWLARGYKAGSLPYKAMKKFKLGIST